MLVLSSAEKLGSTQGSINVILVSVFLEMAGMIISKSWEVEKEVIQCFDIKTTSGNRIKCV